MARSRYSETDVIDGNHFATFSLPVRAMGLRDLDFLSGVKFKEHTFRHGERLDIIAAREYGDDSYWWVIALVNGIAYPFASGGLGPGRVLKIPVNVQDILQKIFV